MNKSEVTSEKQLKFIKKSIIAEETLTVIVCDTCKKVAAQLGSGKFDGIIASLEIRNQHQGHIFTTFDRTNDKKYRERPGVGLKTEYIQ